MMLPADPTRPALAALRIADPPERWRQLGFTVEGDRLNLGGVELCLDPTDGDGITAWAISGLDPHTTDIDGISTATTIDPSSARPEAQPATHPNGATSVDHVVIVTPDFERTASTLEEVGIPLRRIRPVPATNHAPAFRQGFRRLGPAILELVEATAAPAGPARLWGLVVIVEDLEALAVRLGDRLGKIKPAVQPGRHIATLRRSAGLGVNFAFMDAA